MGAPKVVITGTGRTGTTLLVRHLTDLGLDTGFGEGKLTPYGHSVRAGLECRVDDPDAPTVVKDMTLGFRLRAVLESGTVSIGHVILPTRRLDVATASRVRAADYGRAPFRRGALTGTMRGTEQARVLRRMKADIVGTLADFGVPYTELDFPRFAADAVYLHHKLSFLVPTATVADFQAALDRHVRADLIHQTPLTRRERWRTRWTTAWMVLVRFPIARIRTRVDPEGSRERLRAAVAAARQRDEAAARLDGSGPDSADRVSSSGGPPAPA